MYRTAMTLAALATLQLAAFPVQAEDDALYRWYRERLFQPNERQIAEERAGKVVIYDGLLDTDVARALDEEFDRVDAMMFIRTVVTEPSGEPKRDEATGDIVADDDC
jgi:hypothetical protein